MAEKKPSSREQIKQIVAGIEDGIQRIFQSEHYTDYLRTMSRFHTYSYKNTILIHMQMPTATQVAGFNKWKNQFGRHVKKGEKGLTIIAPTPYKKKIEEMKLDPDTKAPVLDGEGKVVMEEREVEIPLFRPVKVFDVSQTEGRPLPSLVADLTGNVQHYEAFMEALRRTSPIPITIKPLRPDVDGLCNYVDQVISIQAGMSQVQTVCATVHEITHAMLHDREHARLTAAAGDETKEPPKPKDERTKEVEAESVSYTVCQYFGIETGANSLGYIATWSKDRSLPELKASLETISKTANALITSIDRHFAEICKERGIELTAEQPEQAAVEVPTLETPPAPELPDTPERFMEDMLDLMDRLYAAGQIKKNFPPDNREQIKANLARNLLTDPGMVRAVLEQFVREDTGVAEAGALLERLDALASRPLQSEKEYVYKVEVNPGAADRGDMHFIQAYERLGNAKLNPEEILFVGSADQCQRLVAGLEDGTIQRSDFVRTSAARISHYTTKDGMQMDAFVGMDDKVYLGRRDHYDNRGHYFNQDQSLLHISDNEKMFNFISGGGYSISQADMMAQGAFTLEDCAEFDALRVGVLAQFEQVEPFLFAGEPFQFIQPGQEQPAPMEPPDAAPPDTKLDEYPMPDDSLTLDDLPENSGLLPLSRERAAELLEQDMTVYMVESGKDPAMVFDRDDLMEQPEGMMFAVPREEWEESPDFRRAVADRMNRQEEREQAFLDHGGDCFAIYQIRSEDDTRDIHFQSMDWLKSIGRAVERSNYDLVYTAPLSASDSVDAALDQLWYQFNNEHPADFQHPSMSVSDIIALKRDGVVTCHYCDSFGFKQLTDFLTPKPTVAELEHQAKNGQPISLMDLADAIHRERNPKKSVVAQLKNQPQPGRRKTAPKKSAEREI